MPLEVVGRFIFHFSGKISKSSVANDRPLVLRINLYNSFIYWYQSLESDPD